MCAPWTLIGWVFDHARQEYIFVAEDVTQYFLSETGNHSLQGQMLSSSMSISLITPLTLFTLSSLQRVANLKYVP